VATAAVAAAATERLSASAQKAPSGAFFYCCVASTGEVDSAILAVVPGAGIEPARLAAGDFESPASTNFTTRAGEGRELKIMAQCLPWQT
jgi:hypothetical protein